jgi:hypothetical protein
MKRSLSLIVGLVFVCGCGSNSPTSPTGGTVFRQGTLVIPQAFIVDLDEGVLVNNPLLKLQNPSSPRFGGL